MDTRRIGWALSLFGFAPFALGTAIELAPLSSATATPKAYTFKLLPLYAAVILSFLGGIRWGIAVSGNEMTSRALIFSVLIPLWAWVAAFFAAPINYLMFAVGFAFAGIWDSGLRNNPQVPQWFVTLRKVLTWLVVPALLLAAIGTNLPLLLANLGS